MIWAKMRQNSLVAREAKLRSVPDVPPCEPSPTGVRPSWPQNRYTVVVSL